VLIWISVGCMNLSVCLFHLIPIWPIVSGMGLQIELFHKNLETFKRNFLSCPLIILDIFYKTITLHNQIQTTCANMGGVVIYKCN
jgi:hypothetical protein